MDDFTLCFSAGRETKKNYTNVYMIQKPWYIRNIGKEGDMDIERLLIFIIKTDDWTQNGRRPARAHHQTAIITIGKIGIVVFEAFD